MQNCISNKSVSFWNCSVDKNVWYLIKRRLQDDNSKLFRNQVQTMHTITWPKDIQLLQGSVVRWSPIPFLFYVQTATCLHFLYDDETMRNNNVFLFITKVSNFLKWSSKLQICIWCFFMILGISKMSSSAYVHIYSVIDYLYWKCAAKRCRPLHSQLANL